MRVDDAPCLRKLAFRLGPDLQAVRVALGVRVGLPSLTRRTPGIGFFSDGNPRIGESVARDVRGLP
jgi:hypothetical protein